MPAFENHLFISYAHLDNEPLTPEQQGWITRFHASLSALLSMRLGRKAEIWRDGKLTGNDIFGDEIVAQFPKTALLMSVLSPRYVKSDWCPREVREFCKVTEQSGGARWENKSRIIKVIKTPVENEEALPAFMAGMTGYPFYVMDDDQTPLELDPAYGPGFAQQYNVKIAKLAFEVAKTLEKMESASPEQAAAATMDDKPTIYLAECSYDRRPDRETLETELRRLGYSTLPDESLPRREDDYVAAVARLLEKCKLSIHLVGSAYGGVPDGPAQKSEAIIQNELAIQRAKSGSLKRLIWLPEGTSSQNADQQAFINNLHQNSEFQFGADLVTSELEPFKAAIQAALVKLEAPAAPVSAPLEGEQAGRQVYLICDERDRPATVPLRKFLKSNGHEPKMPVFEGCAADVRKIHQDLLSECDAVLVFYGAGDEAWKRTVDNDLKAAIAYRCGRPLLARYTFLSAPLNNDKQDLVDVGEPNLINGLSGFSESIIMPFVSVLDRD